MNENIDLTKILKNCPKGTEFYSSVHGKLKYLSMYVSSSASEISFEDVNSRSIIDGTPTVINFYRNGRLYFTKGECTLFPSKDQRDWSKFTAPWLKKEKFDPKTLQPFDKVLVRENCQIENWYAAYFSHIEYDVSKYDLDVYEETPEFMICTTDSSGFCYCIPYNDETKQLVGTTDEAPEYYRYWED